MHHLARKLVPNNVRHLLPRVPRRVVIVGGGPTGLFCADRLRHHFEVTLVDVKDYFEFTPGILRALGDPTTFCQITFGYREVLENSLGVEFIQGEVVRINPEATTAGRCGSLTMGTSAGNELNLSFDYCVVAVGVGNGVWKPRFSGVAVNSSMAFPIGELRGTVDERNKGARRETILRIRERLAGASGAVVVGAGLVGVELAAELAHFFPRLGVTLVDGSAKVLPQLAEGAREYARVYLQHHGVRLKLGVPFSADSVPAGHEVLWCVGTKPRCTGLFGDASVLTSRGMIRVNKRMQVLHSASSICSPKEAGGESTGAKVVGLADSANFSASSAELVPICGGRIFAVGDTASVEGVPTAQMIFHGEEMAAIAVSNIESLEDISSPFALSKMRREAEADSLPLLCNASLGPQDGMFSTQSELLATGILAALQKQLIQDTKMGALRGELFGSLAWMPVH